MQSDSVDKHKKGRNKQKKKKDYIVSLAAAAAARNPIGRVVLSPRPKE